MSLAFSAPGKALLAGGYLVLDSYDSYVVALSARMHCVISSIDSSEGQIEVISPQFANGKWLYQLKEKTVVSVEGKNPFVYFTIKSVLNYLKIDHLNRSLKLTIFSDKEYHSQENTVLKHKFPYHTQAINDVPKTGLGSSAGLVTVVTASILSQFIELDLSNPHQLNIIHNLAQFSHCQAQGKVGSGFDVAAATFGSIVYKRFDPALISSSEIADFTTLIESDWNITNSRVSLPKGIRLLMGDIKTGSNTPKLVSKVTAWKKADVAHSSEVYANLDASNLNVIQALKDLTDRSKETQYFELLNFVSSRSSNEILESDDNSLAPFKLLIQSILSIRKNMRTITKESGAEIEPLEQTKLLDSCLKYKGVLGGVVPGAGGFDAISILIVEDKIEEFIKLTKDDKDFKSVTWLDLREEAEGLRKEEPSNYPMLM